MKRGKSVPVPPVERTDIRRHVLDTFEAVLAALNRRAEAARKVDPGPDHMQMVKAGQVVAVIAMADQFLATMPVEVALKYRQSAKMFNASMSDGDSQG